MIFQAFLGIFCDIFLLKLNDIKCKNTQAHFINSGGFLGTRLMLMNDKTCDPVSNGNKRDFNNNIFGCHNLFMQ